MTRRIKDFHEHAQTRARWPYGVKPRSGCPTLRLQVTYGACSTRVVVKTTDSVGSLANFREAEMYSRSICLVMCPFCHNTQSEDHEDASVSRECRGENAGRVTPLTSRPVEVSLFRSLRATGPEDRFLRHKFSPLWTIGENLVVCKPVDGGCLSLQGHTTLRFKLRPSWIAIRFKHCGV